MAELKITSAEQLSDIAEKLALDNSNFRSEAAQVESTVNTITGKWTGEASDQFRERFNREKVNFDSFAELIDNYVKAIQQIVANYQTREDQNIQTANSADNW